MSLTPSRTGTRRRLRAVLRARRARASEATSLAQVPGVTTPVTIEQLGRLVQSGVTQSQLPKAIDQFNAGQPVSFGPLTVSPAGIAAGDPSLPWSDIQGVRTHQGFVHVKKSGKWLSWKTAPVSKIPNFFVFEALVRAILAQRPPAADR